jgi:hypothetical protein
MTRVPQPSSLESKFPRFGIEDPKNRGMLKGSMDQEGG